MPWRETDAMRERIEFVVLAMQGEVTLSELCRRFVVSRKTGYKWLQCYRSCGSLRGLEELSRRPHHSPGRTSEGIEARVVALRQQFGWGGRKLALLLAKEGMVLGAATVDRIIQRRGLVGPDMRGRGAVQRFERAQPNELWQMDFKGEYLVHGHERCFPLTILDDHSRYLVGLYPLASTQAAPVKRCLVECFDRYGLPEAMLLDHGVPWWSVTNGHGLTHLSVFLLKQDIRLIYGAIAHPQTRGKIERLHRTLNRSLLGRGLPGDWPGFRRALGTFRHEYNDIRPHHALAMAVPADRYRPSSRPFRLNPPEWHYRGDGNIIRLNTQGCLDYQHQRYFVCEALAREPVFCQEFHDKLLVTYRGMHIREINLATGRTAPLIRAALPPVTLSPMS
jgi:transposase InsO family protein/transposase-like protein